MNETIKINYKNYPEYMFAIVASYLPSDEGHDLTRISGKVVFKHKDCHGNTYKNGLLHSYHDLPALVHDTYQH
jgi:hypothetical protein